MKSIFNIRIKQDALKSSVLVHIGLMSFFLLFSSCVSKPGFTGNADLCGLIIDENNVPVKDFVVYCKSVEKNHQKIKPVVTNEGGLFVFFDILSGSYRLSGEKKNYLRIKNVDYDFNDRTKIICLQTKSFKASLQNAEELIWLGEKELARELLNSICCDEKSEEKKLVDEYKKYTVTGEVLEEDI